MSRTSISRLAAMLISARPNTNTSTTLGVAIAWLAPLVIILTAWLAYRHSFDGPFIFDDKPAITDNPFVRQLWPLSQAIKAPPQTAVTGRPVVSLSLAINHSISGYEVRGYHLFNLFAHMAAALALYGVVRRTLRLRAASTITDVHAAMLAMVVATAWTVHPLASDTVLYVSNRTELLMGLFAFLTLYCSIRSLQGGSRWLWNPLAVIACLLGMLSKESMAALPLLVIAYDWVFSRDSFRTLIRARGRRRGPLYAVLLATWIPLLIIVLSGARSLSVGFNLGVKWWEYLFTQTQALLIYLKLSVWPDPLSILYDTPVISDFSKAAIPGAVIVLLLLITIVLLCRRHWLGFFGAWYFLILAPSSSVVPLVTELVTERRMYAPLAAIVAMLIIAGDGVLAWMEKNTGLHRTIRAGFAIIAAVAVIGVLAWTTDRRSDDFDSERLIYEDAVRKAPNSYAAHNNLGLALMSEGRIDGAIEHFQRTIKLNPESAEAFDNLGVAFAITGRFALAQQAFRQAMQFAYDFQRPTVLNDYAYMLATCPDPAIRNGPEAVRMAEEALSLKGENTSMLDTLASAYAAAGRFNDAARTARRGIDLATAEGNPQAIRDLQERLKRYAANTADGAQ